MGAGQTIDLAVQYGQIVFGGMIFLIFSSVASGILRSEGDVKRAMYAMAATAILNIILDPIFIYYFGWGISGAAWATILSAAISCSIILYWLLLKRNTYISFSMKDFKPSTKIVKDILAVGMPAGAETFIMSLLAIILNIILVSTSGTDAVAVYTAGWRVVLFAMIPSLGIGTAAITVAGAAYGAKKYNDLSISLSYSTKLGFIIGAILSIITYVFAPSIASIFSYSPQSAYLAPTIASFLQIICLFFIIVPFGVMASSIFQAMGKGMTSLILTIIREIVCICVFAYIFAITLGFGDVGVWWGIIVGGAIGCIFAYLWAHRYIKGLQRYYSEDEPEDLGIIPGK